MTEFCVHRPFASDYILRVRSDKILTDTDENVILGFVYVRPTQSRFYNDDELLKLENEIMSVCSSNKYVVISEDINARVGKLPDYVHLDQYFLICSILMMTLLIFFDKTTILENLKFHFKEVLDIRKLMLPDIGKK